MVKSAYGISFWVWKWFWPHKSLENVRETLGKPNVITLCHLPEAPLLEQVDPAPLPALPSTSGSPVCSGGAVGGGAPAAALSLCSPVPLCGLPFSPHVGPCSTGSSFRAQVLFFFRVPHSVARSQWSQSRQSFLSLHPEAKDTKERHPDKGLDAAGILRRDLAWSWKCDPAGDYRHIPASCASWSFLHLARWKGGGVTFPWENIDVLRKFSAGYK